MRHCRPIVMAPLFIVWLGVGSSSCIVVALFIAFFPVVVSTATGIVSAKPEVLQLCRSLTASEWQIFGLAGFPYAMLFVFAGMKVNVTMAMIGAIVGEFITARAGLGYIIMFASSAGEMATVLAAIVLLCAIAWRYLALSRLARWLCGADMAARCRSGRDITLLAAATSRRRLVEVLMEGGRDEQAPRL
jgi:ABC-type nitrate/sulfonate/bicarbonate transport system permease component